jgi:hypothetical protein
MRGVRCLSRGDEVTLIVSQDGAEALLKLRHTTSKRENTASFLVQLCDEFPERSTRRPWIVQYPHSTVHVNQTARTRARFRPLVNLTRRSWIADSGWLNGWMDLRFRHGMHNMWARRAQHPDM